MTKQLKEPKYMAIILGLVTTIVILPAAAALLASNAIMTIGLSLLAGYLVYSLGAKASGQDNAPPADRWQTHGLAILLLLSLLICVIAAAKSLSYNPGGEGWDNRFVYENIATTAGLLSIILTFVLSWLQKDIYWITRKKTLKLDERQVKQRQQVFEISYKIGAFLVLGATFVFANTIQDIPHIIAMNFNAFPGHILWIPVGMTISFFALPLIVAAWRKDHAK